MAASDSGAFLQPGIAAVPPLPGDDLDLEWLEGRALARREASCQLRTVLSAARTGALRDAGVGSEPSSPRGGVRSPDWEPSVGEAEQLVRYVTALKQPAVELLKRWDADVLGTVPSLDGACTTIFQDLRRSREARAVANHQLQACIRRKGAAAASLDEALALRQQEDEHEAAAHEATAQQQDEEGEEEEDAPACAADDTDDKKKKKKHKGWGKKLMHKMGGSSRSKSAHKKEAAEKEAAQQSRAVEQVAEVKVRKSDETLQAAQDELMECVEELGDATEEMDRRTEQCLDAARSLVRTMRAEEKGHRRGVREAVQEAALALEEWACEAGASVMELKIANGSSTADSDRPLTLSTAEEGVDAMSDGSDSLGLGLAATRDLSAADLEELAAKAAEENEALQLSLPPQRRGADRGRLLRDLERQLGVAPEDGDDEKEDDQGGESDSDDCSDGSGWSSGRVSQSLSEIVGKNRDLERTMPAMYLEKLRRGSRGLGAGIAALERLPAACAAAVEVYAASGGACSSTGPPATPPATWQTQTSLAYTPTSAAPTGSDFLPEELLDDGEEEHDQAEEGRAKRKRRGVFGKLRRAAGRAVGGGSSTKHEGGKQFLQPPVPSSAREDPSEGSGQEQQGLTVPASAPGCRSQSAAGPEASPLGPEKRPAAGASARDPSDAAGPRGAVEGRGRSPDLEKPALSDPGAESPEVSVADSEEELEQAEEGGTTRKKKGVFGKVRRAAGRAVFGSSSKHEGGKQSLPPPVPSSATEDPSEGSGQEQQVDEGLALPGSKAGRAGNGGKDIPVETSPRDPGTAVEPHGSVEGQSRSSELEKPALSDVGAESPEGSPAESEEEPEQAEEGGTKRKRRGVFGKVRRAAGRAVFGSSSKHEGSKQSLVPPVPGSATEDRSEGSGQEQQVDEGLASTSSRPARAAKGGRETPIGASPHDPGTTVEPHGDVEGCPPDLERPGASDPGAESPEESEWWRDSGAEDGERPGPETNPFRDDVEEDNPFQDDREEVSQGGEDAARDRPAAATGAAEGAGPAPSTAGPEVAVSIPIPSHPEPLDDDGSMGAAELALRRALAAPGMEAALERSDAALHRGRTSREGCTEWRWEGYAIEEAHSELHRSSQCMTTALTEEGWKLFAYELLLLLPSVLAGEEALGHVRAALPVLRVALGVATNLHHQLAELTLPDGSQSFSPLDVRFRAALLLRAWARAEALPDGLGGTMEGLGGADPAVRMAWIQRQLALLRSSVLLRLAHLQQEGGADSAAKAAGLACVESLDALEGLAEAGEWGQARTGGDVGGRRALLQLLKQMDLLGPAEGSEWRFHTVVATKVFSLLWRAAADPEAPDGMSLDAPKVAACLLCGLHPALGQVPLRMETHALLLAQGVWSAHAAARGGVGRAPLAAQPLGSAAGVLGDFGQWLQCAPVNMARCFARARGVPEGDLHEAELAELLARRLCSVDLRDGLVQALCDYQNHLEPEAFPRALALWRGSHRATLLHAAEEGAEDKAFIRGMGRWLVWSSVSAAAERSLTPFDKPPQLQLGDADAFRRAGPMIKKHIEGLAEALERLTNELESERKYYNPAWEQQELGGDHLSVSATALARAALPRVDLLVKSGVWPSRGTGVADMPAAGGRLLKVLEATDRAARRWGEQTESLIDILLPHACAALEGRLSELERDITSSALKGEDDEVFQPSWPPTLLHCEGVITLWRFTHEAFDSPVKLGVPVDIIVGPYLPFLEKVLHGARTRLVRDCESDRSFRLARRADVLARGAASGDFDAAGAADFASPDGSGGGEAEATATKTKRKSRTRIFFRSKSSSKLKGGEDAAKNVISEAELLQVEPKVTESSVQQVTVRLNSIGFCLAELDAVYKKLKEMINTADDSDNPTQRHNQARCLINTEFPELQDTLQDGGHVLVRYLAARLVYFEMRQDIFERLYFAGPDTSAAGSTEDSEPGCLTMEALLARKQDSLLGLASRMPAHLLVMFVTELGRHLSNAWTYVVMDYLRRSKAECLQEYIDDDQEALRQFIDRLIDAAKEHEDGEGAERTLRECNQRAETLMIKASGGTTEQLAAFAARVFEEGQETLAVPQGRSSPPRSASPALRRPPQRDASSASASPRRVNFATSPDGGAGSGDGAAQKDGEERSSKKRKSIVKGLKGLAKFGGRSGKQRSNADATEDAAALDGGSASAAAT